MTKEELRVLADSVPSRRRERNKNLYILLEKEKRVNEINEMERRLYEDNCVN